MLETLMEQGFIDFASDDSEVRRILRWFHELGIVDKPRTVSGAYGASLISEEKAEALKLRLKGKR